MARFLLHAVRAGLCFPDVVSFVPIKTGFQVNFDSLSYGLQRVKLYHIIYTKEEVSLPFCRCCSTICSASHYILLLDTPKSFFYNHIKGRSGRAP